VLAVVAHSTSQQAMLIMIHTLQGHVTRSTRTRLGGTVSAGTETSGAVADKLVKVI